MTLCGIVLSDHMGTIYPDYMGTSLIPTIWEWVNPDYMRDKVVSRLYGVLYLSLGNNMRRLLWYHGVNGYVQAPNHGRCHVRRRPLNTGSHERVQKKT